MSYGMYCYDLPKLCSFVITGKTEETKCLFDGSSGNIHYVLLLILKSTQSQLL